MTPPSIVAWETTRRCGLSCRHCRAGAGPAALAGELSPAEGLRLVQSLARLPARLLILTGGEPMMRPDIYDLAAAAAAGGLRVVIAPCGPLLTDETAARLKSSGVSAVSISLDAATAADHDAFRGVPGAFESALRGLRHARRAGLATQVNCTATRLNARQLPAILELAEREGAATLDFFFLVPTGRGRDLWDLQLDARQVEETLLWIAKMDVRRTIRVKTTCAPQMARVRAQNGGQVRPESSGGGCMAGRGFLFVSHAGLVQPCGFLDLPCGDVRAFDFDLPALLDASADLRRLGALEGIGGKCGRCAYLRACGGCRARAYEMGGDAMGAEPFCVHGTDRHEPS
jgi:radical SAM protein with 4Fe4S-binding SPASM domain